MRVNQSIDDPTFLQLNDRSSELPFCCKRGHSAILPSTQFFPVHAVPNAELTGSILRNRSGLPLAMSRSRALGMSAGHRAEPWAAARHDACNQFRVRWIRLRREVGSGKGRRDWPARRDRVETSDGLTVVVDLATNSAMAAEEMNRRQPISTLGSSPVRRSLSMVLREMPPRSFRASWIE